MNTGITIYDRIADPAVFLQQMGSAICRSGMFGCQNEEQGKILAMACMVEQSNPVEIARVYHIIKGKLTMRADAMLAEYRKRGGKCKWESRVNDVEKARAQFIWEDHDSIEEYSKDDARREGLLGKDNYKNSLPDMLRARLVSKVVRMLAPEICAGYYTSEELDPSGSAGDDNAIDATFSWPVGQTGAGNGHAAEKPPQKSALEIMREKSREAATAKEPASQGKEATSSSPAAVEDAAPPVVLPAREKQAAQPQAAKQQQEAVKEAAPQPSGKDEPPEPSRSAIMADDGSPPQSEINTRTAAATDQQVEQIRFLVKSLKRFCPDQEARVIAVVKKLGHPTGKAKDLNFGEAETIAQSLKNKLMTEEAKERMLAAGGQAGGAEQAVAGKQAAVAGQAVPQAEAAAKN
jgi:hypothetical protein